MVDGTAAAALDELARGRWRDATGEAPGQDHAPAFLICRDCGTLAELPAAPVRDALTGLAAETGFQVERVTIEALGLCPAYARAARP